jgi:threonine/homoserine/homoserine lactone efflux protein
LILFLATIVPLVCTPGPDILFVSSHGLTARRAGALLATAGICLGYLVHAVLATAGIAALIAASPTLFAILRTAGAVYLLYLGCRLLRAAWRGDTRTMPVDRAPGRRALLRRGATTSLLNPKGLLFYLSLLPQFVRPDQDAALQTLALALVFVATCFVVYVSVGLAFAAARARLSGQRVERTANGIAGTVLVALGIRMAAA